MKIHKLQQGSDEWFEVRKGKMTASHAQAIASNGKGLETYIYEMIAEQYSTAERENYTNEHMERGNELEDQARSMYELENDTEIEQVGFIEIDEFTGASPDGLIGDDGGIEIKCHSDKNHFKLLIDDKIDTKYLWQIQMNMLASGRDWWIYLAYNPNFEQSMYVKKIEIDKKMQEKLKEGIKSGKKLIKELKTKYEKIRNKK